MNILSLGSNKLAISFNDIAITINQKIYSNLTFIIRLLTLQEIMRLNSLNTDDNVVQMTVEEDVFNLAVERIVGIDEKIDLDNIESGIISTIAGAIISTSNHYLFDLESGMEKELKTINVFDQIQLVVIRGFNMSFKEVEALPIDILIRKFILLQTTFPDENLEFKNKPEQ